MDGWHLTLLTDLVVYMAKGAPWAPSFFCRTTAERGAERTPLVGCRRPLPAGPVGHCSSRRMHPWGRADHGMRREADRMSTDRLEGNKALVQLLDRVINQWRMDELALGLRERGGPESTRRLDRSGRQSPTGRWRSGKTRLEALIPQSQNRGVEQVLEEVEDS